MTTPNFEWTCVHCGQMCGGTLPTGYAALGSTTRHVSATCSPDDPAKYPDCNRRITEHGEPVGALVGVDPLPVGVENIRS
jgi:hypothetical protein